jgi:hypothetical protein
MNVLILGCARSGSSIFGELFEMLPGFHYYFEPHMDEFGQIDYSNGPVAIKKPKADLGASMTPGLPFALEELLVRIPEPRRIFWQVRHPLDAICSLRPGIESDWAHNPRPPGWESLLDRPWVERCARHWANINGAGFHAIRKLADFSYANRYEDFIADPRKIALRACSCINMSGPEVDAAIDRWCSLISNEKSPRVYEARRQKHWSRQDHTIRTGRWKQNLSPEDVSSVLPIVSDAAKCFGYELPSRRKLFLLGLNPAHRKKWRPANG